MQTCSALVWNLGALEKQCLRAPSSVCLTVSMNGHIYMQTYILRQVSIVWQHLFCSLTGHDLNALWLFVTFSTCSEHKPSVFLRCQKPHSLRRQSPQMHTRRRRVALLSVWLLHFCTQSLCFGLVANQYMWTTYTKAVSSAGTPKLIKTGNKK